MIMKNEKLLNDVTHRSSVDALNEYFRTSYIDERKEIAKIDSLLSDVLPLFQNFFLEEQKDWPYEIEDEKTVEPMRGFSYSTSSMILFMMAVALGYIKRSSLFFSTTSTGFIKNKDNWGSVNARGFENAFEDGFTAVVENSLANLEDKPYTFYSTLFGCDDPFTLAWFIELIVALEHEKPFLLKKINKFGDFKEKIIASATSVVKNAFKSPSKPFLDWKQEKERPPKPLEHTFPLLRAIHLYKALCLIQPDIKHESELVNYKRDNLHPYILNNIHKNLSFYDITDSSFDAAELAFCLEGLLLLTSGYSRAINGNLLRRAFFVIEESQKRSPYWRPLKPVVSTPQGFVLLPLSIESANSLLRICKYLESDLYFSNNIEIFKRYSAWLYTYVVEGSATPGNTISEKIPFSGWHSEHILALRKVNPWQTSQIVLFLLQYKEMLQKHIAHTSITIANFSIESFVMKNHQDLSPYKYWKNSWQDNEPLIHLEDKSLYKAFAKIGKDYILPRDPLSKKGKTKIPSYSMILYGPPGTGKTSIAEEIAKSLNMRLITITPSDFIAHGEAEVEARAKAIFQTLNEQDNVIILFDEIDRLILDRDSIFYREQSDIFQFMTPGMLVKLKNLRERAGSIFIIATNYEERIDPAVKRMGRIDFKFLILPPDKDQRLKIIRREVEKRLYIEWNGKQKKVQEIVKKLTEKNMKIILSKTVLETYGELKQLVTDSIDRYLNNTEIGIIKSIEESLENQDLPAIRLSSYKNRFIHYSNEMIGEKNTQSNLNFTPNQLPITEFLMLVYLKLQVSEFTDEDRKILEVVLNIIITTKKMDLVKEGVLELKPHVRQELSRWIKDVNVLNTILNEFYKSDSEY